MKTILCNIPRGWKTQLHCKFGMIISCHPFLVHKFSITFPFKSTWTAGLTDTVPWSKHKNTGNFILQYCGSGWHNLEFVHFLLYWLPVTKLYWEPLQTTGMPTSNMRIPLHIVRLNAIYFKITVHECVINCAAQFTVTHTEKELTYFLFFSLLSGKKCTVILQLCWYVNVFIVILPTIFHYKICLQNKHYRKICLKAVMVANFNTILLGQQPCQVFQISWLSEIRYISIIRVLISEHWWQKCCWSLKCQLIWQLYAPVSLRAFYRLQTMCICNPINLYNFQFFCNTTIGW